MRFEIMDIESIKRRIEELKRQGKLSPVNTRSAIFMKLEEGMKDMDKKIKRLRRF